MDILPLLLSGKSINSVSIRFIRFRWILSFSGPGTPIVVYPSLHLPRTKGLRPFYLTHETCRVCVSVRCECMCMSLLSSNPSRTTISPLSLFVSMLLSVSLNFSAVRRYFLSPSSQGSRLSKDEGRQEGEVRILTVLFCFAFS